MASSAEMSLRASWRAWWEYEKQRQSGGSPVARFWQLVRRWDVLRELILRELKSSYGGSFLGYAWTLFSPLLQIAVYAVIFGRVARFNLQHYPLFIATGQMAWQFFNGTLTNSMRALNQNSGIISTINLPREIFPLTVVGENFVEYLLSMPVVFIFGFAYGVAPDRYIVLLPLAVLIETVLLVGLGLLLSSVTTLVPDTQRIIRPILRMLFFLSPILYPTSRVHGTLLLLYKLNPLVGIVELNRLVWYPHYLVTPAQVFQHIGISAGVAVLAVIVGWAVFIRLEPAVLKEL